MVKNEQGREKRMKAWEEEEETWREKRTGREGMNRERRKEQ